MLRHLGLLHHLHLPSARRSPSWYLLLPEANCARNCGYDSGAVTDRTRVESN